MAKRKRKETDSDGSSPLVIGDWKSDVTVYNDEKGQRVQAIRCGQCKGRGCEGCYGMGFLAQVSLL